MATHQSPLQPFNPFEVWSSAALAGAAAMSAAVEATRTATTSWLPQVLPGPDTASSEIARQTEPVTKFRSEDDLPSPPSIFSFFSALPSPVAEPRPTRRRETPAAPATSGKSWYRSPYKSPFDPMFWLSPGHPVDHVPEWMVLTGMAAMMPGTTSSSATGWPMPKPPSLWPANAWNANIWAANPWGNNPWTSSPLSAMALAASPVADNPWTTNRSPTYPSPMNAWNTNPWPTNPWPTNPWTAWLDASSAGWSALSATAPAPTNVVDFSEAYSTYRTAGGHASAQLSRSSDRATPPRSGAQYPTQYPRQSTASASASAIPDIWTSLLWPWLPKN